MRPTGIVGWGLRYLRQLHPEHGGGQIVEDADAEAEEGGEEEVKEGVMRGVDVEGDSVWERRVLLPLCAKLQRLVDLFAGDSDHPGSQRGGGGGGGGGEDEGVERTCNYDNVILRDLAYVREIGCTDLRKGLRGQMGVFSRELIHRGTVIPVVCPVAVKEEYEVMHTHPWELVEADRYAYEFLSRIRTQVLIADLKGGCQVQYINDARGSGFPVNVEFCEAELHGWPYLFIVAIRPIPPHHELLIDYGNRYWDRQEMESWQMVRVELLKRLTQLRLSSTVLDPLVAHVTSAS